MENTTSALKTLIKRVNQRKKIITEIAEFIATFITKNGERIKYEQGSCHTHAVYEFKNFAGFDMLFSTGETMFGGTTFRLTQDTLVVFDIHYQCDLSDCRVNTFFDQKKWLPAFRSAMKRKDTILKIREGCSLQKKEDGAKKEKAEGARKLLIEEARNLGLDL